MILSEGLAYDKCDVGVVTDVRWQEGMSHFDILNDEQAYKVVRTQIDVVRPSGTAVLNAADAQAVEMAPLCDGKVIFYSTDPQHAAVLAHCQAGERAVILQGNAIVLVHGTQTTASLPLANLRPEKASKPDMVMAAVAAAWALNIPIELIGAGLRTFESSPKKTPY
jgi:cyanophycin synthetase